MDPVKVLRMARELGSTIKSVLLVGCEPGPLAADDDMQMEMSDTGASRSRGGDYPDRVARDPDSRERSSRQIARTLRGRTGVILGCGRVSEATEEARETRTCPGNPFEAGAPFGCGQGSASLRL